MVQALLLMLEWQDHIQVADKNFHVSRFLFDLAISGQYHKVAYISVLQSAATVLGCEHCHKLCSHFYDHGRS